MIYLDPCQDKCTVTIIKSRLYPYNTITTIKGTPQEVCDIIVEKFVRRCPIFDNWLDDIYVDICGVGYIYADILESYGIPTIHLRHKTIERL